MVRVSVQVLLQVALPLGSELTAGAEEVLSPFPATVDLFEVVPEVGYVHPARPAPVAALGGTGDTGDTVILMIRGYW